MQSNPAMYVIRAIVWSLAGLVVLFALLLGFTAAALPGCTGCHRSASFVTQTAAHPHAGVSCVQCHVQPGVASRVEYAYHVIFGMTLHLAPTGTGPIAGIPDQTCLGCHESVQLKTVSYGGLSIQHSTCDKGRMCTDCHSDTAHGTAVAWPKTSQMNDCLDCHSAGQVRSKCTTCHAQRSTQELLGTGEWKVTHGPNWKQTHGMGDLKTCASCHPDDFCVQCHGIPLPHDTDFIRLHPPLALTHRQSCTVCHQQQFCDNCHGIQMPHPPSFTPAHPKIVKQQGQTKCLRCHDPSDCTNCHIDHVHPGGAIVAPGGAK